MNAPSRTPTVISSRDLVEDTDKAKRSAENGPVFITDDGSPTYVLLTKEEYDRLEKGEAVAKEPPAKKQFRSLAEALADPRPEADFEWEPPRLEGFSLKVPDLE